MGIPIKNRSEQEFLRAYKEVYDDMEKRGFKPKFHKLDNKSSAEIQKFIASRNANVQFAPPDMHRQNAAERAVRTWKNHFI